jgi:hypothetical protein
MAKRNYDNDFPSVTQVLDVLRKIGLEMWFKFNTPEEIARLTKKALTIGTQTHEAIETFIKTGELKVDTEYPDEVANALQSFVLFRKEHPEFMFQLSETPLTSVKHGFNGTIDCPNPPFLFDWKSTEKKDKKELPIWDEWITQTSTYAALWNEMMPNKVTTAYVVALAKDCIEYRLHKIELDEINDRFENIFLSALKIKNYSLKQKKEKKDAVQG